jgi:hypothetical protein
VRLALITIGHVAMFSGAVLLSYTIPLALCLMAVGFCLVEGGLSIQTGSE